MKKHASIIVVSFLVAFTFQVKAQNGFSDNFNDSNLTSNPVWNGETSKFEINAVKELQLNNSTASSSNESYLTTNSTVINDAFWEFYVRLDFNPSTSNFAKVYLVSDNQDLTAALNGYYVQIGGQTGTIDNVKLYRQDGVSDTLLIDGASSTVATSPAIKLRVTKSTTNVWSLFLDQSGVGNSYQLQGTSAESKYGTSNYFGVLCKYTSTRSDKFYFDDFLVSGSSFQDTVKPFFSQLTVINDRKIELSFNEKLDSSSALTLNNYRVDQSIGNPSSVLFSTLDSNKVELSFATSFTNGSSYTLTVQNIEDTAGNVIVPSSDVFVFFIPVLAAYRDIVINELYPDDTPSNGLPEAEFIELFNASNKIFDMNGWVISDGTTNSTLSNLLLRPSEYLIICPSASTSDFLSYGIVQGLASFPTLNNTEDNITLQDNNGQRIDFVSYTVDWYQDENKKNGGYSLEQINPYTNCIGASNFTGASDPIGGTPGAQNSQFDTIPDIDAPVLLEVLILNDSSISLRFNESMDSISVRSGTYAFSPSILIDTVFPVAPNYEEAILELNTKLESGVFYSFSVSNVNDCAGNFISTNSTTIALPSVANKEDLIINEILFNPRSGSFDFVELYNRSEKVMTLENWLIANFDDDTIANFKMITESPVLIFPKEYVVLTESKIDIIQQYPLSVANNILEITDLPTYNDDEGSVYLFNSNQELIDEVKYKDDYHFTLLDDDDGVSLERINSESPSLDKSNWHSASEKVGFATPGYKNSQDFTNPKSNGTVTIEPNIVSPDNDGFQDVLSINYKLNAPGFVANVSILDRNGRLIKRLVNNELLGSEGSFIWDGISDDNTKARVGIYVVLFEIFNLNGDKEVFKQVITVASQLK